MRASAGIHRAALRCRNRAGSESRSHLDGAVVELSPERARIAGKAPVGRRLIDEEGISEVDEFVVRDRQHLSEDGVVVPIIAIDKHTGKIESLPEIVTRGFLSDNGQELVSGARDVVIRTVEQSNSEEKTDWSVIKEKIRVDLKRYINKQTSKRPLILPVILEV